MLDRKLYKTKLCILYQRGRCARQSCTFAHGEAELRRFGGSANDENFALVNGRRDYRGGDLRDKLDRRYSPHQRFSPVRDAKGRHTFHSRKPIPDDRGYSASRSPVRRRHGKKQRLDGQSDVSGSFKNSDCAEDQIKAGKVSFYDETDVLEEQLKQAQFDIEMLDDQKSQLEAFFDEKAREVDKLSATIEELKAQLSKEQEDCKRMTSKIKKFIKGHGRYLRAQEELKRSQARLLRLGDQLGSDALKLGANEEDSSVNVVSDGEPNGDNRMSPRHEIQSHASPIKRSLQPVMDISEETKPGSLRKSERFLGISTRSEKLSRVEFTSQSENKSKETEAANMILIRNDVQKLMGDDSNKKGAKNSSPSIASLEKVKISELGHILPSTSMAAHAVDELIEAIEMEEKSDAVDASVSSENGAVNKSGLPFLPPLPPRATQNTYNQYEDDDDNVDVEEVDVDIGDPDVNSEVEIEQV